MPHLLDKTQQKKRNAKQTNKKNEKNTLQREKVQKMNPILDLFKQANPESTIEYQEIKRQINLLPEINLTKEEIVRYKETLQEHCYEPIKKDKDKVENKLLNIYNALMIIQNHTKNPILNQITTLIQPIIIMIQKDEKQTYNKHQLNKAMIILHTEINYINNKLATLTQETKETQTTQEITPGDT